jgi:hypothetical protein
VNTEGEAKISVVVAWLACAHENKKS